ncbi:AAA family ATPase [Salinibaculum rarum]|uniref:AAA family ATPase n=1 Tax=Salinibaculum rarum TaxID=3058903 RepID=UPI00266035F8|nr:AAA family ATPase [Salinibaculum sp. KK48]
MSSTTSTEPPVSIDETSNRAQAVIDRVSEAVITDQEFLETLLTGVFARGHVLLEDVPGTGKTLTGNAIADALGVSFNRIQFTPDLLPSDITGTNIYNEHTQEFEFSEGPLFANIVLADEINRAPPKTQAALLEAMEEAQVTVDGETYDLPEPFFVIATQNPVEQEGTFELPEAQRDRFIVKTSIGYPEYEGEIELMERRGDRLTQMPSVEAVTDQEEVTNLQMVPEYVSVERELEEYMLDLARYTRDDSRVDVGVSPRGVQRFYEAARARAVIAGRDYVAPDDVKAVAEPVMKHRIIRTAEAKVHDVEQADVVADALDSIEVPAVAEV